MPDQRTPIDPVTLRKQHEAVKTLLGHRWAQRYPKYASRGPGSVAVPRLVCRLLRVEGPRGVAPVILNEQFVVAVGNVGTGSSRNTVVEVHAAHLPAGGVTSPSATRLLAHTKLALEPGESRELVLVGPPPGPIVAGEQRRIAAVCYDPIWDAVAAPRWTEELLPRHASLLRGADRPATSPPLEHWQELEFDSATARTSWTPTNRTWAGRVTDPPPAQGAGGLPAPTYFASASSAAVSELRQTVSPSGQTSLIRSGDALLTLRAAVRSHAAQPPDQGQVLMECLDASGGVLATLDLGRHAETGAWKHVGGTVLAPSRTTSVRVRLRSVRRSTPGNVCYFDLVRLYLDHRQVTLAR